MVSRYPADHWPDRYIRRRKARDRPGAQNVRDQRRLEHHVKCADEPGGKIDDRLVLARLARRSKE